MNLRKASRFSSETLSFAAGAERLTSLLFRIPENKLRQPRIVELLICPLSGFVSFDHSNISDLHLQFLLVIS
jgi:hypothetical protein